MIPIAWHFLPWNASIGASVDRTKDIFHISSLMLQVQYDATAARLQKWEKIEVR